MKKIFTLLVTMAMTAFTYAQLPDGSIAPDFNLYEINRTSGQMITDQTINLYDMLNDYKTVYIDVSATTCGPCQTFHNSGTLESIYNNYGPNSTVNDSRVLFVEGSQTGNSWASLNGTTSGTWNCVNVPYPVIPLYISPNIVQGDGSSNYYTFHSGYAIGYFPTLYMVCPNRMSFLLSGGSANTATAFHNQIATKCPAWTNVNDALLTTQKALDPVCFSACGFVPKVYLQNVGMDALTSAEIKISCGSEEQIVTWTGNLAQFESELAVFPSIATTQGSHTVSFEIISANGVADNVGTKYNTHSETFNVQPSYDLSTISQTFSTSVITPWVISDNSGVSGGCAVYNSAHALRFRAYNISSGTASLYVPLMNFTDNTHPFLSFDVAYSRFYNNSGVPTYSDGMQVQISADCGVTWTTIYDKYGESLETFAASGEFNAPAGHYRTEVLDLSDYAGTEHVMIKFVFISGYGNNIFLDNINISDGFSAIESVDNSVLSIYPNPVKDVLTINYDKTISQIDVYDVNGKLVNTLTSVGSSINISDLSEGVYMLNILTEEGLVIRKIVKE